MNPGLRAACPEVSMPSCHASCMEMCQIHGYVHVGLVFAGREDGALEVWDLLERSHEPILTAQPSAAGIASLAFSPGGAAASETSGRPMQQLLAVGALFHPPAIMCCQHADMATTSGLLLNKWLGKSAICHLWRGLLDCDISAAAHMASSPA